jgi:hypothetical protein
MLLFKLLRFDRRVLLLMPFLTWTCGVTLALGTDEFVLLSSNIEELTMLLAENSSGIPAALFLDPWSFLRCVMLLMPYELLLFEIVMRLWFEFLMFFT